MDEEKKEQEIILDTPSFTLAGLEAIDIGLPLLPGAVLFLFITLLTKLPWLGGLVFVGVFIAGVVAIKNRKSGKGWGYTKRLIYSFIRRRRRKVVYVS